VNTPAKAPPAKKPKLTVEFKPKTTPLTMSAPSGAGEAAKGTMTNAAFVAAVKACASGLHVTTHTQDDPTTPGESCQLVNTRDYAAGQRRCLRCESDLKNINAAVYNAKWTNGVSRHFDTKEVIGPVSRIVVGMRGGVA